SAPEVDTVSLGFYNGVTVAACGNRSSYSINGTNFTAGANIQPKQSQNFYANEAGFFIGSGADAGSSVIFGSGTGEWSLSEYDRGQVTLCALPESIEQIAGGKIPLSNVIAWIHERANIP